MFLRFTEEKVTLMGLGTDWETEGKETRGEVPVIRIYTSF